MNASTVKGHVLAVFPNLRDTRIRMLDKIAGNFLYTHKGMAGNVSFMTHQDTIVGFHELADEWIAQHIVMALCDAGVKP